MAKRQIAFVAFPENRNVTPHGEIMWDGEMYTVWDETRTEKISETPSLRGAVRVYLDYLDYLENGYKENE